MYYSRNIEKTAEKYKAKPEEVICADLMCIGYSETDAFNVSHFKILAADPDRNEARMKSLVKSAKFKKIKAERRKMIFGDVAEQDTSDLIDKVQTARLIMRAAMKQQPDSKERIEGLMKYSDLMGFKREETDGDATDYINFFFPLKCDQCPLLQAYNESHKGNEISPVEMNAIVLNRWKDMAEE